MGRELGSPSRAQTERAVGADTRRRPFFGHVLRRAELVFGHVFKQLVDAVPFGDDKPMPFLELDQEFFGLGQHSGRPL